MFSDTGANFGHDFSGNTRHDRKWGHIRVNDCACSHDSVLAYNTGAKHARVTCNPSTVFDDHISTIRRYGFLSLFPKAGNVMGAREDTYIVSEEYILSNQNVA